MDQATILPAYKVGDCSDRRHLCILKNHSESPSEIEDVRVIDPQSIHIEKIGAIISGGYKGCFET